MFNIRLKLKDDENVIKLNNRVTIHINFSNNNDN